MTQIELPVIPHRMDGKLISQRVNDGYISATGMCNAAGKRFNDYSENKTTKEFLDELAKETGIPPAQLVQTIQGGPPGAQGTWVHPDVAIHLAQWLSPKFAVRVSKWVREWMSGGSTGMPVHIRRYMANRSEIPHTHFSMLNEITFALIAPMESAGYTLPEHLVPDISEGKMFSRWLREAKGIDTSKLPSYNHRYNDGRVVPARLYPNQLLAEFRAHFNEVWLPTRAEAYFKEKDPKALPHLPKLLPKKR